MSRRVLALLLVVSLLFNFAVLIGFWQSHATQSAAPQTPSATNAPASQPQLLTRLARELHLNDQQSGALQDIQHRQQQQASVFGDSLLVVRQDLQDELRKQEPDLARVRTLVGQEAELVRQRRLAETDLYGEFVGLLSSEQRQRLGDRFGPPQPPQQPPPGPQPLDGPNGGRGNGMRQRGGGAGGGVGQPPQPPPPDIVRRYDHNNNGRLDPDEAKEARKELEDRRREVLPRDLPRPPLWPWFDADGDGELNDAERAEMEAFMREHRAPPPPPPQQQGPPPEGRGADRRPRGNQRPPQGPEGPPPSDGDQQPPRPPDSQPGPGAIDEDDQA